jgi:hypothetical protein
MSDPATSEFIRTNLRSTEHKPFNERIGLLASVENACAAAVPNAHFTFLILVCRKPIKPISNSGRRCLFL